MVKPRKEIIDVSPNTVFLHTLRNSGYNNYTAISDIIDNSLDEKVESKNVHVQIKGSKNGIKEIRIADDGSGMEKPTIIEALKLGALTGKSRNDSLGSYGTGLKAASLSIGRKLTIWTKHAEDAFYILEYDLDEIVNLKKFKIPIRVGHDNEYETFKTYTNSDHGTVIFISNLDRITVKGVAQFKNTLAKQVGLVYKYFIDEEDVNIYINDDIVESIDPMKKDEPFTKLLATETFVHNGTEVKYNFYHLEKSTEKKEKLEDGRRSSNAGLYIYRNKRLVGKALDLGIINKMGDGYKNGIRVEVFVDGSSDHFFGSTFNKMIHEKNKNEIDHEFKDKFIKSIAGYINTAVIKERDKTPTKELDENIVKANKSLMKDINENEFVKPKSKNPPPVVKGKKKSGVMTKTKAKVQDSFLEWRLVNLGELGSIFRTLKEDGRYIVEMNKDHVFWTDFLSKTNHESYAVVNKLFIALGMSQEKVEYFDDEKKHQFIDEYMLQMSDTMRKLIKY